MIKLSDDEFHRIVTFVKDNYGINLSQKRQLIEARMYSVLAEKQLASFGPYMDLIQQKDAGEVTAMLNKLTTNHTFFLREPAHFEFLKNTALPALTARCPGKELRIWSAGCSSGEEAYTIAMVVKDYLGPRAPEWDTRILATDISQKVMEQAKKGVYAAESLGGLPAAWKQRYFAPLDSGAFELRPVIKNEVLFHYLNLMEPFPFRRPFDLIFCRNVMIYFDQDTKNALLDRLYGILKPGGYLMIGHSETVQRDKSAFQYLQPSIYRRGV